MLYIYEAFFLSLISKIKKIAWIFPKEKLHLEFQNNLNPYSLTKIWACIHGFLNKDSGNTFSLLRCKYHKGLVLPCLHYIHRSVTVIVKEFFLNNFLTEILLTNT